MTAAPVRGGGASLVDLLERVLDKGLVINADIIVSLVGTELLGIRLRAAIASFETAVRYGLEFPGGTRIDPELATEAREHRESCPQCGRRASARDLLSGGCRWCGWSPVVAGLPAAADQGGEGDAPPPVDAPAPLGRPRGVTA